MSVPAFILKFCLWKFVSVSNFFVFCRNTIQIVNLLYQINGNIGLEGELKNGTVTGNLELILQNDTRIGINIRRAYRVDNAVHNYDLNVEGYYYPDKTQGPTSANFNLTARDTDFSNYLFDVRTDFAVGSENLKNFTTGIQAKRMLTGDKWSLGGEVC